MAALGTFRRVGPSMVESEGGPGILWYPRQAFVDFVLIVDWRLSSIEDNSGVFVRFPALTSGQFDRDENPAVESLEVQIDDRGLDSEAGGGRQPVAFDRLDLSPGLRASLTSARQTNGTPSRSRPPGRACQSGLHGKLVSELAWPVTRRCDANTSASRRIIRARACVSVACRSTMDGKPTTAASRARSDDLRLGDPRD
jgi:hypothetical protein